VDTSPWDHSPPPASSNASTDLTVGHVAQGHARSSYDVAGHLTLTCGCGGDGEEGAGQQADRGPAVPGGPGGDLAAAEPGDLLGLLVIFPGFPSRDGCLDQLRERDGARGPAQEVADGAGVAVPAQEQDGVPVAVAFRGVVGGDLSPGSGRFSR
jgi:hypothetical protein